MEEKNIRKLSLDEMDKVNGGNNTVKNTSEEEEEKLICLNCGEDRPSQFTWDFNWGTPQLRCNTCGKIVLTD